MACDCGSAHQGTSTRAERRAISIALILNATMFVVGTTAGLLARSSGLLADALDMLADSVAYGIALIAIGRSTLFKVRAANLSGAILAVLGLSVIADAVRRGLAESAPEGLIMLGTASLSLGVNALVLRMLSRYRKGEVHLRASWIFTRADVIANIGVICAALLVIATKSKIPDVLIGVAIGCYVVKEALEIFSESRSERSRTNSRST